MARCSNEEKTVLNPSIMTQANNQFAIRLFRVLSLEASNSKLLFSPFSIESAMLMALEGARGETADEMGHALAIPESLKTGDSAKPWGLDAMRIAMRQATSHADNQELAGQINTLAKQVDQYRLNVSNSIWVDKQLPLLPSFAETLKQYYGTGGAFSSDFLNQTEAERKRINQWVNDRVQCQSAIPVFDSQQPNRSNPVHGAVHGYLDYIMAPPCPAPMKPPDIVHKNPECLETPLPFVPGACHRNPNVKFDPTKVSFHVNRYRIRTGHVPDTFSFSTYRTPFPFPKTLEYSSGK